MNCLFWLFLTDRLLTHLIVTHFSRYLPVCSLSLVSAALLRVHIGPRDFVFKQPCCLLCGHDGAVDAYVGLVWVMDGEEARLVRA